MPPSRLSRALHQVERHVLSAVLSGAGVTLLAAGLLAYVMPFGVTASPGQTASPAAATSTPSASFALPSGSTGLTASASPPGKPAVATRVTVPALRIDLPIVSQATEQIVHGVLTPSGPRDVIFPYCNVAEYITSLSQPGQPGTTYLFAHARVGMFLPLLTASMVDSGASMLGDTVLVYTSDSKVYWYSISKVKRGVPPTGSAVWDITKAAPGVQQLVLQTSEGPYDSSTKLQILARFELVQPADPAEAHPTPHPVVCA